MEGKWTHGKPGTPKPDATSETDTTSSSATSIGGVHGVERRLTPPLMPTEWNASVRTDDYPDATEVLADPPNPNPIPLIKAKAATHMHSLSITTATPEDWENVHSALDDMVMIIGKDFPSVTLSSHTLDHDDGVVSDTEFYDQYTEERVFRALVRSGLSPMRATGALNCMKDSGILFRERTP